MACPGGCVNGGGQPTLSDSIRNSNLDLRAVPAKALYTFDKKTEIRASPHSPTIKMPYGEYLEQPGSRKAHECLHTEYTARKKY